MSGKKFDTGKLQWSLLPWSGLQGAVRVLEMGAAKYSRNNWKEVPDAKIRYMDAMLRHIAAMQDGDGIDSESGLPHIDHVVCNAMFLAHFEAEEEDPDAPTEKTEKEQRTDIDTRSGCWGCKWLSRDPSFTLMDGEEPQHTYLCSVVPGLRTRITLPSIGGCTQYSEAIMGKKNTQEPSPGKMALVPNSKQFVGPESCHTCKKFIASSKRCDEGFGLTDDTINNLCKSWEAKA